MKLNMQELSADLDIDLVKTVRPPVQTGEPPADPNPSGRRGLPVAAREVVISGDNRLLEFVCKTLVGAGSLVWSISEYVANTEYKPARGAWVLASAISTMICANAIRTSVTRLRTTYVVGGQPGNCVLSVRVGRRSPALFDVSELRVVRGSRDFRKQKEVWDFVFPNRTLTVDGNAGADLGLALTAVRPEVNISRYDSNPGGSGGG